MSNRNFDSRVIIQRLQDQNRARSLYQYNKNGMAIVNNPQTSDSGAGRINTFHSGSETMYFRGLIGEYVTTSLGATCDFTNVTSPS